MKAYWYISGTDSEKYGIGFSRDSKVNNESKKDMKIWSIKEL